MKYEVVAYGRDGREVRERVDASDEAELRATLKRRGLMVCEVSAEKRSAEPVASGRERVPYIRVVEFAREMAVLVSTGTTVVDALQSIHKQCKDERWRAVLGSVTSRVEEGVPLSAAMGEHPRVFDSVCRSLVAAGESSGQMDDMLKRLSELARKQLKVKSAVRGALVYPILLTFVSLAVLVTMSVFVLPRFRGLFEELDADLPVTTEILLTATALLTDNVLATIGCVVMLVLGVFFWARSNAGQIALEKLLFASPKVGTIARSLSVARLTRLLGVLLRSRVPLTDALQLTRASMTRRAYVSLLTSVSERVTKGDSMASVFEQSTMVPASVTEAIRNGEASGRLSEVLLQLADHLDEENETTLRTLSSIVEPAILVVLGTLVAFVAISLFMPLFDLTAAAGA